MASSVQPRPLGDIVSGGNYASPLAQLSLSAAGSQLAASSSTQSRTPSTATSTVPPIDFNLFRSPSIYSVSSLASLSTISADEQAFNSPSPESPSTPKASRQHFPAYEPGTSRQVHRVSKSQDYAASADPPRPQLVPKRSFVIRSRVGDPEQPAVPPDIRRPQVGRTRTANSSNDFGQRPEGSGGEGLYDITSMHGEQGADWGEDEAQFEWLDTDEPEEVNGNGKGYNQSPSKRFGRFKAAMGGHGPLAGTGTTKEEPKKLKKALVFPRRAPPPPPGIQPHPNSPRIPSAPSPSISHPSTLKPVGSSSWLDVPDGRRPGLAGRRAESDRPVPTSDAFWSPSSGTSTPRAEHSPTIPAPPLPSQRNVPIVLAPVMIPIKDTDGPSEASKFGPGPGDNRYSQMSMQSAAYSFYDLDSPGPSTPRATTPTQQSFASSQALIAQPPAITLDDVCPAPPSRKGSEDSTRGDLVFPHGKYVKVSVSKLEKEKAVRERQNSTSSGGSRSQGSLVELEEGAGPEYYVAKGVETRGKGDLPRSAWYFMKAAEAGSSTGRMYWGLALRHGWGVARDDRRAFAELRKACDDSLAEGGINFYQSPGTVKLSLQQKRNMTRDVSLGMFEIANCFLEGVGVKKAPDIAMAYLRFAGNLGDIAAQEQLGFLLSKGGNGVKKDMKEAAKWYRMAIGQGSTNTFGLAWIWKDKYMQ